MTCALFCGEGSHWFYVKNILRLVADAFCQPGYVARQGGVCHFGCLVGVLNVEVFPWAPVSGGVYGSCTRGPSGRIHRDMAGGDSVV